jgi:hypothetical protein
MMKKIAFLTIISLILLSCSEDDYEEYVNCVENNEVFNGFVYKCNTYNTEVGRINMNSTSEFNTTSCMLEFINSEYSDFSFEEGDTNINIVNIWISVPAEYYALQEIPEGIYQLGNNDDNPFTLDIVTLFRFGPSAKVIQNPNSDNLLFNGLVLGQPEAYEQAELSVTKLPTGEFEIEYIFEAEGVIFRGHYKGFLSFVDNWS